MKTALIKVLRIVILLIIAGIIGAAGTAFWLKSYYSSPLNLHETKVFIVEKGRGINQIAQEMEDAGIIKYPFIFAKMAKMDGKTNPKFGEYAITPTMSPEEVLVRMEKGETILRKVVVPEGKSVVQIYEMLKKSPRLKLVATPEQMPAEGTLLPSTYYYTYGDTDLDMFGHMQRGMQILVDDLWEKRSPLTPVKTKDEALILASIVEKETGHNDDRLMVSSVFTNRINKGMKLESDPTAVYGITKGVALGRKPSSADVKHDNPFNTYKIEGLPPTPICNPGAASIAAVLNPPQTEYLFFVANGTGGHNFSVDYKEHQKNIGRLRDYLSQREAAKLGAAAATAGETGLEEELPAGEEEVEEPGAIVPTE